MHQTTKTKIKTKNDKQIQNQRIELEISQFDYNELKSKIEKRIIPKDLSAEKNLNKPINTINNKYLSKT